MHTQNGHANNEVTTKDGLIVVKLKGYQDKDLVEKTLKQFKQHIHELREQRRAVYVIIDYHTLQNSDVTTEARIAVKEALGLSYTSLAVIGNATLAQLALYLVHASGAQQRARHFTTEKAARRWIEEQKHPRPKRGILLIILADIIGFIGFMGLLGWVLDNRYMMGLSMYLRPINPWGAIGLLLIWMTLAHVWLRWWTAARVAGSALIALGAVTLLPIPFDNLLFSEAIKIIDANTALSDLGGFCFIALGITAFFIDKRDGSSLRICWIMSSLTVLVALFGVFSLLYARELVYGLSDSFAMSFPLGVGLALAGVGVITKLLHDRQGNIFEQISRVGWLIMAALISVQIVTFTAWQQSIDRNKAEANRAFIVRTQELDNVLRTRLRAYIDALYGFKGLFAASDTVSEKDFKAFYENLDLTTKYPGIQAISYISLVDKSQLDTFVAERRADTSVSPDAGNFTIQQQSNADQHYILTYVANSENRASLGRDFTDVPIRLATYQQALQSGEPAVSDTLALNIMTGEKTEQRQGFFITIPIPYHDGQGVRGNGAYIGFVSAIFVYDDFFKQTFSNSQLLESLDLCLYDSKDHTRLYGSMLATDKVTTLKYNQLVPISNRTWSLEVEAATNFGTTISQNNLPSSILSGGQSISLLLIAIFWILNRSRQRAVQLANDITLDLQHERNEAIATKQKDEAILSSIGDAVFAIDTQQNITLFNPAAQQISGITAHEAIGRPYHEVLNFRVGEQNVVNNSFITKALGGKQASMQNQTVLVRQDGSRIPVADSAAPIYDMNGKLLGAIVVFRDISKEYELDRAKTEFVSLASHQLRTPLSAINWYTELLLDTDTGPLNTDRKEYLKEIDDGNKRMIELVNSLLDVSRLDLGKLSNAHTTNDMSSLIASVEKELALVITNKHITVQNNIAPDLPKITAEPKLLRMIVQNLLSNAVKYTAEDGSVTVVARPATPQELAVANIRKQAEEYMFFSVTDTGYGIPEAQQPKIFSKLFRADNVRVLDVEGTGLGLYIVKEVAQKLGGNVWFVSKEGKGSTFFVVIPFTTKNSGKTPVET